MATNRQTLSADGSTTWTKFVGPVAVSLSGSFGGGTAKVQQLSSASPQAAVDVAETSKTEAADIRIDFPEKSVSFLRVNIASSTTPSLAVEIKDGQNSPT